MFSRADAGALRVRPAPVDLAALAREVAALLGVLAEERRQTLSVHADGDLPARTDRVLLRQAPLATKDSFLCLSCHSYGGTSTCRGTAA